ncbi:DinB family protein [Streptomyces halstedii]|uniref:DinB family protein n=1 Tax=Streptomyces halstedii TaxID=1944 RepID=A0A6N9TWW6_STRHA|nr:DinB family protein [Streptomyces halstedii]MBV7673214.1 DinB family protein [Streptomyces halstedii]NEA15888.1 DinB family protein [Streptomyces halstedii]
MTTPARLIPLLDQFDWASERLVRRMTGPFTDSGNGTDVPATAMTDEEFRWEPVPGCWSVRRRADGPGTGATTLSGTGGWGRDTAPFPHPSPPPFTTAAWRLSHLAELLTIRADHTTGTRALTRDDYRVEGEAAGGIAAFEAGVHAWRSVLAGADDAALDTVGYCGYPYGSDPENPFLDVVWWVNQEILHHGAEIALLRDLYRVRDGLGS